MHLCEQDITLFLSYAWIGTESPNNDPNLSKRNLLDMFHRLMNEGKYDLFRRLDDVMTA